MTQSRTEYTLPDLPYDYGALEPHLSARILELHHGKHHAAYVAGANKVQEQLAEARSSNDYDAINQLQKNLAFHLSGHVLHSLFWKNMSPDGGGAPEGDLGAAIGEYFGDFDAFQAQLTAAAENVQGSGWGAMSWDPVGQALIIEASGLKDDRNSCPAFVGTQDESLYEGSSGAASPNTLSARPCSERSKSTGSTASANASAPRRRYERASSRRAVSITMGAVTA